MKHSQTKFPPHAMGEFQVISQKMSKFIVGSNFSCSTVFFYSWIFLWNYNNRYW